MTTHKELINSMYRGVRNQLEQLHPDFPWDRMDEADKAVNADLWFGPMPKEYWTEADPLEHYEWKGYEQGLKDLEEMLQAIPRQMYYDADAEFLTDKNPEDDDTNWTWPCKYCGEWLRTEGNDVWVDDTDGDVCSGNDDLENENEPHEPDYYKEGLWIGGYEWVLIDTWEVLLHDEVWKMVR